MDLEGVLCWAYARTPFPQPDKRQIDRLPHVVVARIPIVISEVLPEIGIRKAYCRFLAVWILLGMQKKSMTYRLKPVDCMGR